MKNQKERMEELFGEQVNAAEVLDWLRSDDKLYDMFLELEPAWQIDVREFLEGYRGLNITYDSCFKKIMNPEEHPERLSDFLSELLGEQVRVLHVLPNEGNKLSDSGSLIVMDIVVELLDGSLADVEMQKWGYAFPGERTDCYLSDMTMRQYNRIKARKGKEFSFHDMKKVYMIIIMEHSNKEFLKIPEKYIHRRKVKLDTGAKIKTLHHVTYICLDTFHQIMHNKAINNKLEAWLTFFSLDTAEGIVKVIESYPQFIEYYKDMAVFRKDPQEVIAMYSEALAVADRNTVKYMIEEMQDELEKVKEEKAHALQEKDYALQEKAHALQEKEQVIKENERLRKQLEKLKAN